MRKLLILPLLFSLLIGCGEGRTDYMRTLLHEQDSLNRAYQPLSLDTIRQLTDYFDHHGTNYDRVHAHYLLGSIYRDMGEAPAALASFQHAAEVTDTTAGGDTLYALLAKIHGQMGDLFQRQYHPTQAIAAYREGASLFLQAHDTLNSILTCIGVLGSYKILNLNDSVLYLSDSLFHELIGIGEIPTSKRVLGTSTRIYLERGDYAKAKELLDIYRSDPDTTAKGHKQRLAYNYLFGEYYLGVGQLDSAEYHFRKELAEGKDINNQVRGLRGLYHLYSKKVIVDSLIKYTAAYNDLNDSSNIMRDSEAMLNMQSLYDYSRHEKEALEKTAEAWKAKVILVSSLFLFLLILFGLIMYIRNRKEKARRHIKELSNKYNNNLQRLHLLTVEKHIIQSKNVDLSLRAEQLQKDIDQLNTIVLQQESELNALHGVTMEDSVIYQEICDKNAVNKKLSPSELKTLLTTVETKMPHFAKNMKSSGDSISLQEKSICILIKLGFHSKEIANLMGISQQSLSNIKKKLLLELFNIDGKANELNERLCMDW
ncbi:MAG: hypothetical protein IKT00_14385 [Prevotella sp.]|nr:hypothetical protein [Prevotella sp.]